ncbi:MAG TPA: hypothetical protein VJH37_00175, partial [Candidatus Nanoarchaeia archaeon]|nr:hypothetical protein [Candidatus Nanoarchaeia archaeon]
MKREEKRLYSIMLAVIFVIFLFIIVFSFGLSLSGKASYDPNDNAYQYQSLGETALDALARMIGFSDEA